MQDQTDIPPALSVSMESQTDMAEDSICASFGHPVHGLTDINQPCNGTIRHPVIHGDNNGLPGIAIDDTFQTNFFSSHTNLSSISAFLEMCSWNQAK
jgi:hypothetical protein